MREARTRCGEQINVTGVSSLDAFRWRFASLEKKMQYEYEK
jgi:hypothetical protein